MRRRAEGFALVELVVAILCCAIITLAAMSFLLLGMRVTGESNDIALQQQTARIFLSMVEQMAGSGELTTPQPQEDGSWMIRSGTDSSKTVLAYSQPDGELSTSGVTMMDGITAASVATQWQAGGTCLLHFHISTEKKDYETSVYCRVPSALEGSTLDSSAEADALAAFRDRIDAGDMSDDTGAHTVTVAEYEKRIELLQTLANQYGSKGEILGTAAGGYQYFSEWYIDGYGDGKSGWNKDTPWCACFVSWAIEQIREDLSGTVPRFCSVDDGVAKFRNGTFGTWHEDDDYSPIPGDLVFFDWTGGNDPGHVGTVLLVDKDENTVYTIEGNSGGRVALRAYALDDDCIAGYGALNWAAI